MPKPDPNSHLPSPNFDLADFSDRLVTFRDGRQGLVVETPLRRVRTGVAKDGRKLHYFRASDATRDRYDEVIDPKGWMTDEYRANPVVVDSHNYSSVGLILGTSEDVVPSEKDLQLGIAFSRANPLGKIAEAMVEEQSIRSGSVGFIPLEYTRGDRDKDEPRRLYTKQNLLEFSLTVVPANPNALKLSLKSGALVKSDLTDLMDFLKTLCGDKAEPVSDPSARGPGFDGAQLRQLTEQLYQPIRSVLRRS